MITNAKQVLFRPHYLKDVMTGVAKKWSVEDSLTCKKRLVKIYREIMFNRYSSHHNKYTEKGIKMEQDAITIISRAHKIDYQKNDKRLINDYFTGEPDIIYLPATLDAKCAWSLDTFPHEETHDVSIGYDYQGTAYNDLTGATVHIVATCLVNCTANLLDKEKKSLWFQLGCPDFQAEEYIFGCLEIERNMIFDMKQFKRDNPDHELLFKDDWTCDVELKDRIHEQVLPFNPAKLKAIKDRIDECRDWMNLKLFKVKNNFAVL